jgi:adenosine deaminase
LKWLAFSSLEYSFLPGESLFTDGDFNRPKTGGAIPKNSAKADSQSRMLRDFAAFEAAMLQNMAIFQP